LKLYHLVWLLFFIRFYNQKIKKARSSKNAFEIILQVENIYDGILKICPKTNIFKIKLNL